MMALHPDMIPASWRRAARALVPTAARAPIAAKLQDFANLQYRFHREYGQNRAALARLKDIHAGRTCVIVGNGPSMRDFDVARLDGTDVFCLNRGYLLWEGSGRSPRYLVTLNELVIEQFCHELSRVRATRFLPWNHAFRFAESGNVFVAVRWAPGFARDLAHGLWVGGTVTYAAMQIAYHMGYRRVVLIGVDHAFSVEGRPNEELTATTPDRNHFSSDYFGTGTKWNAPDLALSERAYTMARKAFAADGREILDATEGGRLQVFGKTTLEDALGQGAAIRR